MLAAPHAGVLNEPVPFDCLERRADKGKDWSAAKMSWCCQHVLICDAFDCSHPSTAWAHSRVEWCCQNRNVGCKPLTDVSKLRSELTFHNVSTRNLTRSARAIALEQAAAEAVAAAAQFSFAEPAHTVSTVASTTSASTSTSRVILRDDTFKSVTHTSHTSTARPTQLNTYALTAVATETTSVMSTETSTSTWVNCTGPVTSWLHRRRDWCCQYQQVGCGSHDCDIGLATWETSWLPAKKAWCCQHRGVGCDVYDCSAFALHVELMWSSAKIVWCCNAKQVACKFVQHRRAATFQRMFGTDMVPKGAAGKLWAIRFEGPALIFVFMSAILWSQAWTRCRARCRTGHRAGTSIYFSCAERSQQSACDVAMRPVE